MPARRAASDDSKFFIFFSYLFFWNIWFREKNNFQVWLFWLSVSIQFSQLFTVVGSKKVNSSVKILIRLWTFWLINAVNQKEIVLFKISSVTEIWLKKLAHINNLKLCAKFHPSSSNSCKKSDKPWQKFFLLFI